MNHGTFLAILLSCLGLFGISIGLLLSAAPKRIDDSKSPAFIETNSIGCNKYSYKGNQYWKCPKKLDIDYIEEHHNTGKTTSTRYVPVTTMEDGK